MRTRSTPTRTDWERVARGGFRPPADGDLDDMVAELAACLRDPDPRLRDGTPYVVLRTWIERDVVAGDRRIRLGDLMASRFADSEVQARCFAPLVLDMIVSRGDLRAGWADDFAAWYPAEADLRGHDSTLGWLHAVAHGADLLGTLAGHPDVDPERMLALAARRMLAPTDHLYTQNEDERLAYGIARALLRPGLPEAAAVRWLDPMESALGAVGPGPTPAWVANAARTLRALYLLVDRGVPTRSAALRRPVAHRQALAERVAEVQELVFQLR